MKRINIPAILFCLILAAGCSQDEPATENPDNGNATGKQITVTAAMPDTRVDTRLAYEDETNDAGTGKLVVKWKESEEKIGLFNATQGTSSTLTQSAISLSEDGKKTDFTGKLPNNTVEGDILYAYYYNGLEDYSIGNVKMLNIADITSNGTLAKIKHAMYAKTTYQGGQEGETNISFSFRPLTAALKLTLEGIPSDVTINKLKLSGTNLFYDISVDLTEALPSYSNGLPMGNKEIENLSLSSADNVFYTGLIPGTLSDGMLITATGSDGSEYSATLPDITIEAGNVYVAKVTFAKPATITAAEVRNALEGDGGNAIVIDGDLTLSYDDYMVLLGADQTLTINPGATLTIDKYGINNSSGHTLTINGGGTLAFTTEKERAFFGDRGSSVKLENVTVELRGGKIVTTAIEVGNNAIIMVDAPGVDSPIEMGTNLLTVKSGGRIDINNFAGTGLRASGKLCIDGGKISINCDGSNMVAVECNNTSTFEIDNGGTLTSTSSGGFVYLESGCRVKGASGLFKTATFTLDTNAEVEVGPGDATNALKTGFYKWNEGDETFVWQF